MRINFTISADVAPSEAQAMQLLMQKFIDHVAKDKERRERSVALASRLLSSLSEASGNTDTQVIQIAAAIYCLGTLNATFVIDMNNFTGFEPQDIANN